MEPVVEPNEKVQLDFAGPLPDELNKDAYILVAIDKMSKFPSAKVLKKGHKYHGGCRHNFYGALYFE